jgi:hypothetical protein
MAAANDSPEALLVQACEATDAPAKAQAASWGLAHRNLESDTQFLLLRQLYLAQLQAEQYALAAETAQQMIETGALQAAARADAARAYAALGDFATAAGHQRLAARWAPASLRGVQYARLARLLRFAGDRGVVASLRHAERWATGDRALVRAELCLARAEAGEAVALRAAYEALAQDSNDAPLVAYVGAELALRLGELQIAQQLFFDFTARVRLLPLVERVSLLAEYRRAQSADAPLFAKPRG